VFRPDPKVHDGRFANNGWLQELPHPVTKITWDNAAMLGVATAERLDITTGDVVELSLAGRRITVPACVVPGHADGAVTVSLGYGRRRAGRVGNGVGADAYALRTTAAPWFGDGLEIRKTGRRHRFAVTTTHHAMHGREPVVSGTLDQYRRDPHGLREREIQGPARPGRRPLTLYPEVAYTGYAWGMAIDLTACTGCNACVVACYAENNIPVVGREQVRLGRIMHWIRIDTYHTGSLDAPDTYHQPVPCMHCEKAPCEVVCPVGATVHSSEGLNDMVYNRCVGTRYCSNNCPYKVRRFNFLEYSDWTPSRLALQHNPDVTVRSRGVMEKCTYCVQRISGARIAAEREGRRIRDGEVITACQAACPTRAIVFGDLNDPASEVRRAKQEPLNYALLEELGTQPRTTYLAALRNPNPALGRS
jgi:molybdopterin-containing oxidoreductase family iron-sulfur binding subunit